ncbi:unannotated protein [freshwater metagenome]|uniref:Unannotated protein n=1 Tax=freshwater metagenome TaxID=449393 RepID=A0A6J7IXX5_9ZZZZ|nr:carboxymuconolactone decarboxylase family protein [Actinomycetota bacterium]
MARIAPAHPIPDEELEGLTAAERLDRQTIGVISHRPELAEALLRWAGSLQEDDKGTLPRRLTELVRLRIAFWNQCRSCMSVRYDPDAVSEDLVCSLERPEEADDLSPAERVALRFADLMATDHLAIDDALYNELREHFTEGEIVELGMHCGQYVGMGRLAATWQLHDHLHERFQSPQEAPYTPWGPGALR